MHRHTKKRTSCTIRYICFAQSKVLFLLSFILFCLLFCAVLVLRHPFSSTLSLIKLKSSFHFFLSSTSSTSLFFSLLFCCYYFCRFLSSVLEYLYLLFCMYNSTIRRISCMYSLLFLSLPSSSPSVVIHFHEPLSIFSLLSSPSLLELFSEQASREM